MLLHLDGRIFFFFFYALTWIVSIHFPPYNHIIVFNSMYLRHWRFHVNVNTFTCYMRQVRILFCEMTVGPLIDTEEWFHEGYFYTNSKKYLYFIFRSTNISTLNYKWSTYFVDSLQLFSNAVFQLLVRIPRTKTHPYFHYSKTFHQNYNFQ